MAGIIIALICAALPWTCGVRPAPPRAGREGREQPDSGQPLSLDRAVVLDLLVAGLRSGVTLVEVIAALGVTVREPGLGRVAQALRAGVSWELAWGLAPTQWRELAPILEPSWRLGVDIEAALQQRAESLRATRMRRARVAAARLGVQVVLPLGLCLLPAFILLAIVPAVLVGVVGVGLF